MYDVVVIGNDLSSSIAAMAAVRRGAKVIHLAENGPPDFFCESGYAFDMDPFPLTGLGGGETCGRLLADLDPELPAVLDSRLLNPGLQIIHREHRLELFSDSERLTREMAREFPREERIVKRLYTLLESNGGLVSSWFGEEFISEGKPLDDFFRFMKKVPVTIKVKAVWLAALLTIRKTPVMRRIFESQLAVFSHLCGKDGSDSLSLMHGLSRPLAGVYGQAGKNSLRKLLRSRFLAAGGMSIDDCTIMKIDPGKEIAVNLLTGESPMRITGRRLIVSTKWEKLKMLLSNAKVLRRLNKRFSRIKTVSYPFSVHMGVNDQCFPEKMAVNVILLTKENSPLWTDNLVFLKSSFPGDRECAPKGRRALSATFFLQESPLRLANRTLKEAIENVLKDIEVFLPFIRGNIDFIDVDKSIAWSRKRHEVLNMRLEFKRRSSSFLRSVVKTPLNNVFMTGGMLLPGWGVEGEIMSGIQAARWATERDK